MCDKVLIGRALNERKNADGDTDCSLRCTGCKQHETAKCEGTRALDVEAVHSVRAQYVAQLHERQRTTFIKELLVAANPPNVSARRRVKFQLCGVRLCEEGFRLALGVGRKKLRKAINSLRSGALVPPAQRFGQRSKATLSSAG